MVKRVIVVAAAAAVALPLLGGTASASCLDDFNNDLNYGFAYDSKSPYWNTGYVEYSGLATVTVRGDALASDSESLVVSDAPRYLTIVVGNAPGATTTFVNCVAG